MVHVGHELTVSTGEQLTGEAEEFERLRWVESAELGGRFGDCSCREKDTLLTSCSDTDNTTTT